MRQARILFAIVLCAAISGAAAASTLTLVVPNHSVSLPAPKGGARDIARVVWVDERLLADVSLDVYRIPNMRSTTEHYAGLAQLARSARWTDELRWTLTKRDTNTAMSLPMPRMLRAMKRQRGPDAASSADRDTSVPMTSLIARFDFGSLPIGDYRLTVNAAGLKSSFLFSVRTGAEPELRDTYLRDKAANTRDYAEFRRLELERFQRDPSRLDAALALVDRSLSEGTPAEVTADFDRAIAGYEARRDPKLEAYTHDLKAARAALPEFFAHRQEWWIARDPSTSVYSIRSRTNNQVLRVLKAATE